MAKRSGLSSRVEINTCLDLHCQVAFPEGLASQKGFHCILLAVSAIFGKKMKIELT